MCAMVLVNKQSCVLDDKFVGVTVNKRNLSAQMKSDVTLRLTENNHRFCWQALTALLSYFSSLS